MNAIETVQEVVEITVDSGAAKSVWPSRKKVVERTKSKKGGSERKSHSSGMDPLRLGDLHCKVCETSRTIPQRTPNQWSPITNFVRSLFLRLRNFQHPSLWAQICWVSSIVSFGFAICSNVTKCVHSGNILCQFCPSLLLCLCLDQDDIY